MIHDGLGRRMSPSHANKQGKRYRYYVTHEQQRADRDQPVWRVPAHDLERLVIDNLRGFLCDAGAIHDATGLNDDDAIAAVLQQARIAAGALIEGIAGSERAVLRALVDRIDLHDDHVDIVVRLTQLDAALNTTHRLSFPVQRVRRGHTVKLVPPASDDAIAAAAPASRDPRLIALVAEGLAVRKAVLEQTGSLAQLAAHMDKCRGKLADMIRVSYLAPDIVTAIVEGRQPASLKRKTLMATPLALDWSEQRRQLGFG